MATDISTFSSTIAVVVTYNPPPGLFDRICTIREQAPVILIDNGSRPNGLEQLHTCAKLALGIIELGRNVGIAAALNTGIARARELGAEYVWTFDHDSVPLPGCRQHLEAVLDAPAWCDACAAVPVVQYEDPHIRCRWPSSSLASLRRPVRLVYADALTMPTVVDLAIQSGMLIRASDFEHSGGFDEALFIDLVDTEWCLRMRLKHDRLVVASPSANIAHSLGDVRRVTIKWLGLELFPTHHASLRHWFIARNRILLWRRYAMSNPSWALYELLGGLKLTGKVLLCERGRTKKMKATLNGTLSGVIAAARDLRRETEDDS